MRNLRQRAPSPALVVAIVALFAALGGTSYAAFGVPNNSVGTKQLRNKAVSNAKLGPNSVGTGKIRNGAVTASKLNVSGVTVPTASTVSGQGTLASGRTEIGIIGGVFQNGPTVGSPMATAITFPLLAPVALSGSNIQVAPTANCTGSAANPTAARGFVCIYPDVTNQAAGISGDTGVNGNKRLGFELDWVATVANSQSSVRAEWAYTAP